MGLLKKEHFVCIDCEATGLDLEKDRIIEIAAVKFSFDHNLDTFESLVNPQMRISPEAEAVHHISLDMLKDQLTIEAILPSFFTFIAGHIVVGHGIYFDLNLIKNEAQRCQLSFSFPNLVIDTLRLARLYGESPNNSLEVLRDHFNIDFETAHRALGDVLVTIEVFKKLSSSFLTTESIFERLKKPILMKAMPLGKYKGRKFSEIPDDYLRWSEHQNFDEDLLFSIKTELKKRKGKVSFEQASNPFREL